MSEDPGRTEVPPAKRLHYTRLDLEPLQRSIANLLSASHLVGWRTNRIFYELCFYQVDQGWVARIKAHDGRKSYVTFVNASSYGMLFRRLGNLLESGDLYWKEDEYPSARIQRRLLDGPPKGGKSLR